MSATTTGIEWCDVTWNPIRGCSRVSAGCQHCYAERQAIRQIGSGYQGLIKRTSHGPAWTGEVRMAGDAVLTWPLRYRGHPDAHAEGRPTRIFVNSMSDLFHESVPAEWIDRIFTVMGTAKWHTFLVLTKRPRRMLEWFSERWQPPLESVQREHHAIDGRSNIMAAGWPLPNVWLGVSVEDQATADERIPILVQAPAAKRFVSYEPALGPISLRWMPVFHENAPHIAQRPFPHSTHELDGLRRLDWIIIGGESGPGARPCNVEWIRSPVQQCRDAHVPVFVTQLGANVHSWCLGNGDSDSEFHVRCQAYEAHECSQPCPDGRCACRGNRKGGDPSEWPADLRVREFPA